MRKTVIWSLHITQSYFCYYINLIVFRTGKCVGELTGKQRDMKISRKDMEIHDDTLLVAGGNNIIGGIVERYIMKFWQALDRPGIMWMLFTEFLSFCYSANFFVWAVFICRSITNYDCILQHEQKINTYTDIRLYTHYLKDQTVSTLMKMSEINSKKFTIWN